MKSLHDGEKGSITRSELIDRLVERYPDITTTDMKLAVEIMLEQIIQTLGSGERIEIRGFGSFSLRFHPPYMGHNPKTGEKIMTPGKYRAHFRPSKELRERINNKWC
jgi:integration host factor subunit beta